jgi:hypothetical protein
MDFQGDEHFEMVWETATTGTYQKYFNEFPGETGTFTITDYE